MRRLRRRAFPIGYPAEPAGAVNSPAERMRSPAPATTTTRTVVIPKPPAVRANAKGIDGARQPDGMPRRPGGARRNVGPRGRPEEDGNRKMRWQVHGRGGASAGHIRPTPPVVKRALALSGIGGHRGAD